MTSYDDTQAFTANHRDEDAARAVDELLAEPFGNWHVHTPTEHLQLRVTKKGQAMVHVAAAPRAAAEPTRLPATPVPTTAASPGCWPRTTRCSARWASPTSRVG